METLPQPAGDKSPVLSSGMTFFHKFALPAPLYFRQLHRGFQRGCGRRAGVDFRSVLDSGLPSSARLDQPHEMLGNQRRSTIRLQFNQSASRSGARSVFHRRGPRRHNAFDYPLFQPADSVRKIHPHSSPERPEKTRLRPSGPVASITTQLPLQPSLLTPGSLQNRCFIFEVAGASAGATSGIDYQPTRPAPDFPGPIPILTNP